MSAAALRALMAVRGSPDWYWGPDQAPLHKQRSDLEASQKLALLVSSSVQQALSRSPSLAGLQPPLRHRPCLRMRSTACTLVSETNQCSCWLRHIQWLLLLTQCHACATGLHFPVKLQHARMQLMQLDTGDAAGQTPGCHSFWGLQFSPFSC